MSDDHHCWDDVIPADIVSIYSQYDRRTSIGPKPALIAVDLYELAYQGGARPVASLQQTYPSSCGEHAHAAIAPTRRLFAASREAGLPIFYSIQDARDHAAPPMVNVTKRRNVPRDPSLYAIRPEFAPQAGDVIIAKQRASAFFGTPLAAHLTQLGVHTLIVCGESTSGCVRATAVDAYSHGFQVVLVEECCFDRSILSHKVSLFDLHHKYADVVHIEFAVDHLRNATKSK